MVNKARAKELMNVASKRTKHKLNLLEIITNRRACIAILQLLPAQRAAIEFSPRSPLSEEAGQK